MPSKKYSIYIFLLFFFTNNQNAVSQPKQEWLSRYNGTTGSGNDEAMKIAIDDSGNVYVTGNSVGISSANDYVTVKYNSAGIEQWTRRYDGTADGEDYARGLVIDKSGNIIVAGHSMGNLDYDPVTIKYNPAGDVQWVQRYDKQHSNIGNKAKAIATDDSGNVYIAGTWEFDYLTVKYSAAGDERWFAPYNGTGNHIDIASAIAVDNAGNVYITGQSRADAVTINDDYATVKYNSSGIEQWSRRYAGPGGITSEDLASSIAVDKSGCLYVTGQSSNGLNVDWTTIKYTADGTERWVRRYDGTAKGNDYAYPLALDDSANVYVAGSISNGSNDDIGVIKYDSSGALQWVRTYNGSGNGNDFAMAIALDKSGGIYITGWAADSVHGLDYMTIKYNSSGVQQWIKSYNGTGNGDDHANSIAVDVKGNVYVTGASLDSADGLDFVTIKYSQSTGVREPQISIPDHFTLFQNYPNPFNPSTTISYQLPTSSHVTLKVFDLLGCEVASLVNEVKQPGIYKVNFIANLSSGVYFYQLKAGSFIEAKKLILIR
jgi:uncharacterized delta-60 repeat protein